MDWTNPDAAKLYKPGENMTGPFGLHLIKQCGLDRADGSEDLIVLDNACGTGIVTVHLYHTIPAAAKPRLQVVCGDFSPAMVESVQARIEQSGWTGATAKVVDAQKMELPSNHFTHVITNFAIVGIPDPRASLGEIYRVLRPRGTTTLTIWKHVGWFPIAAAAVESIPGAPRFPSFEEFGASFLKTPGDDKWVEPTFFEEQIRKAGFEDVQTVLHKNETRYKGVEEWLRNFGGITKNAMSNCLSEEERRIIEPEYEGAVVKELKRRFGEGEVVLNWEAWCVTAKVPASKV